MSTPFHPSLFFLYGPPGSGKTSLGTFLAQDLDLPYIDLDEEVVRRSRKIISAIFAEEGEVGFRRREKEALFSVIEQGRGVVSLGGGALLDEGNRAWVEQAGKVLCLTAPETVLLERLRKQSGIRPLLGGSEEMVPRLNRLLAQRSTHYASFPLQLETTDKTPPICAQEARRIFGAFRIHGMGPGYDVRIESGGLAHLGRLMVDLELNGPVVLVSDSNVAPLYAWRVRETLEREAYEVHLVTIPAGERYKNMNTVQMLWDKFLQVGLERQSTVLALGGGVISDLVGFAAGTYLRGIPWAVLPTTLLGMADASLGGKTGIDLAQGKNLAGLFNPPRFVLADPRTLRTLPAAELRSGLAEVAKHAIIQDPQLWETLKGWKADPQQELAEIVCRAMAVKISMIEEDPYEQGRRAALNLGHTIGHGVEKASQYRLRHGEAVAVGMALEARLAERLGLAQPGLEEQISQLLENIGLPAAIPAEISREEILKAMRHDKKKINNQVCFALPLKIGEVRIGVAVDLGMELL